MKTFFVLILLFLVGYFVYITFWGGPETAENTPPPPPPDTILPIHAQLAAGQDTFVVVNGLARRFGVSLISPAASPEADHLVVGWIESAGANRRQIRLSTGDPAPWVRSGPLYFRLSGLVTDPTGGSQAARKALIEVAAQIEGEGVEHPDTASVAAQ